MIAQIKTSQIIFFHFQFPDNDSVSTQFLTKANEHSEWLRLIYIWYLISGVFSTITISMISVIVCWLINGNLNVSHFYHPMTLMYVINFQVHSKFLQHVKFNLYKITVSVYHGIKPQFVDILAKFPRLLRRLWSI